MRGASFFAPSSAQHEARRRFPRGLEQPPESYRFSIEALLLACFLQPEPEMRVLDLGAGCGAAALAVLCREERLEAHGVDIQPGLVAAARRNAAKLGFADRFTAICADLASPALFGLHPDKRTVPRFRPGDCLPAAAAPDPALPLPPFSYNLVLANPPYRQRNRGRLPRSASRLTALFEGENTLEVFCEAAATALVPNGSLAVIYPVVRLTDLYPALDRVGLRPSRLLPVAPYENTPPVLILVQAVRHRPKTAERDGAQELFPYPSEHRPENPLILHERTGKGSRFTQASLAYCPFLACNASR
jgi:tRNA1(Val) A37 N6-methylase TrmN6